MQPAIGGGIGVTNSCNRCAVGRLVVGCRQMLSIWDRTAIVVGLEEGLSPVRIARSIGRSPSVVCRQIASHRGPDGVYQAAYAGRAALAARHRAKKQLLDTRMVLRAALPACRRGARPARTCRSL